MSFIKAVSTVLNKSSQAVEKLDNAIDNTKVVQKVSGKWNSLRFKVADLFVLRLILNHGMRRLSNDLLHSSYLCDRPALYIPQEY